MSKYSIPTSGDTPVDASSIRRHQVFRSASLAQSQEYLRKALSEHELRNGTGEVDSTLSMADIGRVKMMVLRYGPEVEFTSRSFNGFSLVQVPLRGSTEIECDGQSVQIVPGQSALVSPRRQLRVVWSRDCEQLIVRVPNSLVQAAIRTRQDWQRVFQGGSELLAPVSTISGALGRQWNTLLQSLIDLVPSNDGTVNSHSAWIEYCEIGVAVFLLTLQSDLAGHQTAIEQCAPIQGRRHDRIDPLAAAESYARSRLCAPIGLEDLARASSVSARTLQLYCKRWHGVGPMEWLRNLRLDVARESLLYNRAAHVTDVAESCGFGHIGRFAAYYRQRFGELPRHTSR